MRHIKEFDEYLREGTAKKQQPDPAKAKALIEEAEETRAIILNFLKNNEISDANANHIIKNMYDAIMGLIRAEMALEGYNTSGQGAHEAEVAYMRNLGINETDIQFADSLRYYRNGILYYGKKFDKQYAEKVLEFAEKLSQKLKA